MLSKNNVWRNSLTFGDFGAGAGFRVEDAEIEVFDAENETRVVMFMLGLAWVHFLPESYPIKFTRGSGV